MRRPLTIFFALVFAANAYAQDADRTVGLFLNDDGAYEGYTLLAPLFHSATWLLDMDGNKVHEWLHERGPSGSTYLLPDGQLLRGDLTLNPALNFGGLGGRVQTVDWDGNVTWEFIYSDSLHALHHDTSILPNGNILMLAWEYHSFDDAVANGRDPSTLPDSALWAEQIIEVRPTPPLGGEIVWKWSVWDHLVQDFDPTKENYGVVADSPNKVDINAAGVPTDADWIHANAIDYNPHLDQIAISAPDYNEMWVIDHGTTTEEAATSEGGRQNRGGDLLYRWGNPQVYDHGSASNIRMFFQHDTQWIDDGLPGAGNFMVFNNGLGRPEGGYSSVYEFESPADENGAYPLDGSGRFVEPDPHWLFESPDTFFGRFASGAQRQPNGNTLIVEANTGRIFEVTEEGEKVWEYINPAIISGPVARNDSLPVLFPAFAIQENSVFRAYRYAPDYPAFQGRDLMSMGPIELQPTLVDRPGEVPAAFEVRSAYPNPFTARTQIPYRVHVPGRITVEVFDALGRRVARLADDWQAPGTHRVTWDAGAAPSGLYFARVTMAGTSRTSRLIVNR